MKYKEQMLGPVADVSYIVCRMSAVESTQI